MIIAQRDKYVQAEETYRKTIELSNVTKEFKVLNRHEGLMGSIKDLFSRDYEYQGIKKRGLLW